MNFLKLMKFTALFFVFTLLGGCLSPPRFNENWYTYDKSVDDYTNYIRGLELGKSKKIDVGDFLFGIYAKKSKKYTDLEYAMLKDIILKDVDKSKMQITYAEKWFKWGNESRYLDEVIHVVKLDSATGLLSFTNDDDTKTYLEVKEISDSSIWCVMVTEDQANGIILAAEEQKKVAEVQRIAAEEQRIAAEKKRLAEIVEKKEIAQKKKVAEQRRYTELLNEYILPPNFIGDKTNKAIERSKNLNKKLGLKGEFETTDQYEERKKIYEASLKTENEFTYVTLPGKLNFEYDADSKVAEVYVDYVLSSDWEELGSYVGTNAYGAKVKVKKVKISKISLKHDTLRYNKLLYKDVDNWLLAVSSG